MSCTLTENLMGLVENELMASLDKAFNIIINIGKGVAGYSQYITN